MRSPAVILPPKCVPDVVITPQALLLLSGGLSGPSPETRTTCQPLYEPPESSKLALSTPGTGGGSGGGGGGVPVYLNTFTLYASAGKVRFWRSASATPSSLR